MAEQAETSMPREQVIKVLAIPILQPAELSKVLCDAGKWKPMWDLFYVPSKGKRITLWCPLDRTELQHLKTALAPSLRLSPAPSPHPIEEIKKNIICVKDKWEHPNKENRGGVDWQWREKWLAGISWHPQVDGGIGWKLRVRHQACKLEMAGWPSAVGPWLPDSADHSVRRPQSELECLPIRETEEWRATVRAVG